MVPYFSLILPCYNVAKYLERCIRSILSQEFEDYELILVDDGSTDDTPACCDALAAKDKRICVIHKENGGLSSARNAGLDEANGRYVWFIDSDDWIEPGALALLHQTCCNADADVVKFDHYRVEDVSAVVSCEVEQGLYEGDRLELLRRQAFCAAGRYVLSACLHVYRREILEKHGLRFVSERQVGSEDYLFNLQALLHAGRVQMLHRPLYSYERRTGSLTQTYKPDLAQRYVALKEQIVDYYERYQVIDQYGALIERFFLWHLMIGTCVTQEYNTVSHTRSVQEVRKCVRRILQMPETQLAARTGSRDGLPWKKKLLLLAVRIRFEPLLYHIYAKHLMQNAG